MDFVNQTAIATSSRASSGFAANLATDLASFPAGIKVLSLDCFDTIIWRTVSDPKDAFYLMAEQPTFKKLAFTANLRVNAETKAYRFKQVHARANQYHLQDIYQAALPQLADSEIDALIAEELSVEIAISQAFAGITDLIYKAKMAGLKVIVVSDTYFSAMQLRQLLAAKLPIAAYEAIDEVYCSCDYGLGKTEGLFNAILAKRALQPQQLLHIGDNYQADHHIPSTLGMHTFHLQQFNETSQQISRLQRVAASLISDKIGNTLPHYHPFKTLITSTSAQSEIASLLGYDVLGPILYAFAAFLQQEIAPLQAKNKNTKVLYLLRDGYLPYLCTNELVGAKTGNCVRISRFMARAASFRTIDDVDYYLASRLKSKCYKEMCHQLLLPSDLSHAILNRIKIADNAETEFLKAIHQPSVLSEIFRASLAYYDRFICYLENEINLTANDQLLFVDLGYSGTAQELLAPLLKQTLHVDVFGLYLLSLETPGWQQCKKGLLDPSHFDQKALTMLTTHIALFEKLCASPDQSVIDFDPQGKPIYANSRLPEKQHQQVKAIQLQTLHFIKTAKNSHSALTVNPLALRHYAASALARLIYFPTALEFEFMQQCAFDFDLGTDKIIPFVDQAQSLMNLRKRSWLFSIKDSLQTMRVNNAAEWRATNLELALVLMLQLRHELSFSADDLSLRHETIPVVIHENHQPSVLSLNAAPTQDGYFALLVPVAPGNYHGGIQFGHSYQWLQIADAEIIPLETLFSHVENQHCIDVSQKLLFSEINVLAGGLLECLSQTSMLIFSAEQLGIKKPAVLRLVFRPLVQRG